MTDLISFDTERQSFENWWRDESEYLFDEANVPRLGDNWRWVKEIAWIAWSNGAYCERHGKNRQANMDKLSELMQNMPEQWRKRWCNSQTCACMGCANISGGLMAAGFTKEDYFKWKALNNV